MTYRNILADAPQASPVRLPLLEHVIRLWQYRELLVAWSLREIKSRYKQTALGVAWAVLQPLALMVIFTAIFSYFVHVPTDGRPYAVFSYVALVPWTFFATSISFAVASIVNNMSLINKIYFPREILPLAAVVAALLDYAIAVTITLGLLLWYRIPLTTTLLLVPVVLILQIVLTTGVALLLSAVTVFVRDVRFAVPLGLQLWMYASPVIYPISSVPEQLRSLYFLNPMTGIITAYRDLILEGRPPTASTMLPAVAVSLLLFLVGYAFFKKVEFQFADIL